MKVFKCVSLEAYGNGVVLIAANSAKEAVKFLQIDLFEEEEKYTYGYHEVSYPQEMTELKANVTEPKVILSALYME